MLAALLLSALLDVPYLAQTPELCGGAAVAMVMRYWGAHDVFPQDFAPLVTTADGGILTSTLVSAAHDKSWQAIVLPSTADTGHTNIRTEIDKGRPLIALIAVGPRTYHYVVIVGVTDDDIVVHDPAQAPFRVVPWSEFDRAWSAAGRWMMLMLPPASLSLPGPPTIAPPAQSAAAAETPCTALVDRSVQLARDGHVDDAEHALLTAIVLCPSDPAPSRELAGLRFSQQRWQDAQRLAAAAIRLSPADTYAWQLMASTDFVLGSTMRALDAWNHVGEPRVDTIDIRGADQTPQPVIVRATGLRPRQLLTPAQVQRAERRLQALPVAAGARVTYTPIDDGRATVNVFVDERPRVPHGWWTFAHLGARAWLYDEVRVDVAGPLGAGDAEHVTWRWAPGRPRAEVGLALPAPHAIPGTISFEAAWERQSYTVGSSAEQSASLQETRRRAGLRIADWPTGWFRWQAGVALDRFDTRDYVATGGALDLRLVGDRLALSASGEWWAPLTSGRSLAATSIIIGGRSTSDVTRPSLMTQSEVTVVSAASPLALWPGAGTGQGRAGLLRAHTLLHDNVIAGPMFGRTMAQSTTEYAHPLPRALAGSLSVAFFVDVARAWRRQPDLGTSPVYVDAGVGLRVRAPGQRNAMRIDLARGLREGGITLSAGWTMDWPR